MPSLYVYLISSLPMLHFGVKPPFTSERFLETCRDSIPAEDAEIVKSALSNTLYDYQQSPHPVLAKWREFEAKLRNELVKIRSSRRHIDPAKFLRQTDYAQTGLVNTALSAHRNPSVLEGERILDEARWQFLDELSFGHYFDLDYLLIYAKKLLILERWERINKADKPAILEGLCQ